MRQKASIKIIKKEKGTDKNLQNIRYKLTGYEIEETGIIVTTNSRGEGTIDGLSVNQEYTLEEVKS